MGDCCATPAPVVTFIPDTERVGLSQPSIGLENSPSVSPRAAKKSKDQKEQVVEKGDEKAPAVSSASEESERDENQQEISFQRADEKAWAVSFAPEESEREAERSFEIVDGRARTVSLAPKNGQKKKKKKKKKTEDPADPASEWTPAATASPEGSLQLSPRAEHRERAVEQDFESAQGLGFAPEYSSEFSIRMQDEEQEASNFAPGEHSLLAAVQIGEEPIGSDFATRQDSSPLSPQVEKRENNMDMALKQFDEEPMGNDFAPERDSSLLSPRAEKERESQKEAAVVQVDAEPELIEFAPTGDSLLLSKRRQCQTEMAALQADDGDEETYFAPGPDSLLVSPGVEKKQMSNTEMAGGQVQDREQVNKLGQSDPETKAAVRPEVPAQVPEEVRADQRPSVQKGSPEHPDFSGEWLMTGYSGAPNEFLTDLGLNFAMRKAAQTMSFGVGDTHLVIKHDMTANEITFFGTDAAGTKSTDIWKIDGVEHMQTSAKGEVSYSSSTWITDGQAIETTFRDQDRKLLPTSKRSLQGPNELHIEITSTKGNTFVQVFSRQDILDRRFSPAE